MMHRLVPTMCNSQPLCFGMQMMRCTHKYLGQCRSNWLLPMPGVQGISCKYKYLGLCKCNRPLVPRTCKYLGLCRSKWLRPAPGSPGGRRMRCMCKYLGLGTYNCPRLAPHLVLGAERTGCKCKSLDSRTWKEMRRYKQLRPAPCFG